MNKIMLAELVDTEAGDVVMRDKFADAQALAAESERAQEVSRGQLSWEPLTPRELGDITSNLFIVGRSIVLACGGSSSDSE